jgi:hypothetical protein
MVGLGVDNSEVETDEHTTDKRQDCNEIGPRHARESPLYVQLTRATTTIITRKTWLRGDREGSLLYASI